MNEYMKGEFYQCYATMPTLILKDNHFQNSGASRIGRIGLVGRFGSVGEGGSVDSATLGNE